MQTETEQTKTAGAALEPTAKRKIWKTPYFRYGVSLLVLALLLRFIPFHKVLATIRSVPPTVALAVLGCYLMVHLLGVQKWRMMINLAGAGLRFPQALRCYYWGLFGNIFLPSLVGGDLAQASDWPFILRAGTSPDYARRRVKDHLLRFIALHDQLTATSVDEKWLAEAESRDNIFPDVDWRYWA